MIRTWISVMCARSAIRVRATCRPCRTCGCSGADGVHFEDAGLPLLTGRGDYENFGIEDCRVATLASGEYLLTYTAASTGYEWAQAHRQLA